MCIVTTHKGADMATEATRKGLRVSALTGGTFICAGTLLAGFGVDAPDRRCNRSSRWVKWNRSKQHVALNVTTPAGRDIGLRIAFGGPTDDVLRDLPDTSADAIRRLGADRHRRLPPSGSKPRSKAHGAWTRAPVRAQRARYPARCQSRLGQESTNAQS